MYLQSQIQTAITRIDLLPNFRKTVARSPLDKLILPDTNGFSPLHFAAAADDFDLAQLLVYTFTCLNRSDLLATIDKLGKSPLHWAVYSGSVRIVKLLVENGVPLNVQDNEGIAPIHTAVGAIYKATKEEEVFRCREILSYLSSMVDLNLLDLSGVSALHLAAELGDLESVRVLIQNGAWINIKDYQGENCLFYAIRGGQVKVIRSLIEEFNINTDTLNDDDEHVLDLCKSIGDPIITDLVVSLHSHSKAMNQPFFCSETNSLKLSDKNPGMLSIGSGTIRISGHSCA
jgi:ankyrin repeat protein